jgi:putative phosphoribosyl transferase
MLFKDRKDAGKQLSTLLSSFIGRQDLIVFGLPRGGVITAAEVAKILKAPLDVTCPRKIGAPWNPELAIGAVAESGEAILNVGELSKEIEATIEKERIEAQRRQSLYRKGLPPLLLQESVAILVDDGLATGATMKAAIKGIQARHAKEIVVAVPLAPSDTLEEIREMVNKVFCLYTPSFFQAVGQFYQHFGQTSDEEVIQLLAR